MEPQLKNRMSWQKRRSDFNHDWLKNRYLPALAKWNNVLDERVEDPAFEAKFLTELLPQWEQHRVSSIDLIETFEREMSPSVLFNQSPLQECSTTPQGWLSNLVHVLWLRRYPIQIWTSTAGKCVSEIDETYRILEETIAAVDSEFTASRMRPHQPLFKEFRQRCQSLARAIEQFPSRISVI
jgi:hypothetical protein